MENIFIINPTAGQGKAVELIPKIKKALDGSGYNYSIYKTKSHGDGERFVRETCEKRSDVRFFACGGDGSLHEAVNGARNFPNTEIGVIPVGTGNDFVRNFEGIDFLDILSQVKGESIPCDAIEINGKYIANMSNIGFDCEAAAEAAKWKKKPFVKGTLAYVFGVGSVFIRPMGKQMTFIFPDGERIEGKFLLSTLANGKFCGGGFKSSPKAALDDGLIDIGIVKLIPRMDFVRLLPAYKSGAYLDSKLCADKVIYKQCNEVEIITEKPINISLDGEIKVFTHLKAKNVRSAYRFIVPKK